MTERNWHHCRNQVGNASQSPCSQKSFYVQQIVTIPLHIECTTSHRWMTLSLIRTNRKSIMENALNFFQFFIWFNELEHILIRCRLLFWASDWICDVSVWQTHTHHELSLYIFARNSNITLKIYAQHASARRNIWTFLISIWNELMNYLSNSYT